MSMPEVDIDYSLWFAYLQECRVHKITPSLSDYLVFLEEADMDRAEHYE